MGFSVFTEDRSLIFEARYGKLGAHATGGGPILETIALPDRKSLTEWKGREPYAFNVDFLLDDWSAGEGLQIEMTYRKLERMMGIDEGDPQPPQVIVLGDPPGSIPHDFHDNSRARWWVAGVAIEDEATLRNSSGNRVRIMGVISFMEVSEGQLLTSASNKPKPATGTGKHRHTVRKGETLMSIANRYKIKGGWRTLAKLNNIRDPRKLRVGQIIRLK